MSKILVNFGLVLLVSVIALWVTTLNSYAFDITEEKGWQLIYNGNNVIGAYKKRQREDNYAVCCGSPFESNKNIDPLQYYSKIINTARDAQYLIMERCSQR